MNQTRRKKQNCKFISFDIKGFYPAVAKELLSKCLNLVETKIQITEDDNDMFCLFGWFIFFFDCTYSDNYKSCFCYNFSCVNVCGSEVRLCYLLHLVIRYIMYHFLH